MAVDGMMESWSRYHKIQLIALIKLKSYFSLVADIHSAVGSKYWLYIFLVILTGIFEGISLASLIPLLSGVGIGAAVTSPGVFSNLVTHLLKAFGISPTVEMLTLFVVVNLFLGATFFLLQAYVGAKLQTIYVNGWQKRLIKNIFSADWSFFLKQRRGEIINSIVSETQRLGGVFYQAGLLITGIIHGIIYIFLAIFISPLTTLGIFLLSLFLFFLTRPLIMRATIIGKGISLEAADFQETAVEMIVAAKSLKAGATEGEAIIILNGISDRLKKYFFSNSFDIQLAKGLFDFGSAATIATILYVSYVFYSIDPALTMVVLAIFVRLMPKISGLQQSLQSLSIALPALDSVKKTFMAAKASAEILDNKALPSELLSHSIPISIKNISISRGNYTILDGLDLSIKPGECVALVGASGSGKSTLVDAILGLIPVNSGEIFFHNYRLSDLPIKAFRNRIGYMSQETILFNATIYQNITWGRANITSSLVEDLIESSSAFDFIKNLPNGMHTLIGSRGISLSGGERQRVGLLRALVGNPGLLILDEATSALDAVAERSVIDILQRIKGKVTILFTAHRMASVQIADKILVLDGGQIIESGSWDSLYEKKDGFFRNLCDLQMELSPTNCK